MTVAQKWKHYNKCCNTTEILRESEKIFCSGQIYFLEIRFLSPQILFLIHLEGASPLFPQSLSMDSQAHQGRSRSLDSTLCQIRVRPPHCLYSNVALSDLISAGKWKLMGYVDSAADLLIPKFKTDYSNPTDILMLY